MHSAYVAAHPGDADQAAVSAAHRDYGNNMAAAAQTAITAEASAYQTYAGSLAGDIATTMNNIAGESPQRATDYGTALTAFVSNVGAAATLATSQMAAADVTWVDQVATAVKGAVKSAANAWLVMADDVEAAKTLADDYSGYWNDFVHDYLGDWTPHQEDLINEDRQAAQDENTALTTLAAGITAEQFDLHNDELNEWKTTSNSRNA